MNDPADLPLFTTAGTATAPAVPARRLAGRLATAPPPPAAVDSTPGEELAELEQELAPPEAPRQAAADPRAVREIQDEVSRLLSEHSDGPITAERVGPNARRLIRDEVTAHNQRRLSAGDAPLDPTAQAALRQAAWDVLFGLGRLQPLLNRKGLQNLEVRGYDNVWLIFEDGRIERAEPFTDSNDDLIDFIARLGQTAATERPFNSTNRNLDLTLPDGSRLSAQAWFTAYPMMTIRLHPLVDVELADLVAKNTITPSIAAFLAAAVAAGKSILVSGVPGAGKTTLTRALLNTLPYLTPIATIETEDELRLHTLPGRHARIWPGQEMRGGGEVVDGRTAGTLTVNDMIPMALRANAQILVVGEVRGHEVIAMLEAMQAGRNSVSTIHAKNGRDTVERMVTCATQHGAVSTTWAYRQVAQLVDIIVHLNFVDESGIDGRLHRFVDEIVLPELSGDADVSVPALYRPGPDGRAIPDRVNSPTWLDDLIRHGFDPTWLDARNGGWDQPLDLKVPYGDPT